MATTEITQYRAIFTRALAQATERLDDSDLGLIAELATRLAQAPPDPIDEPQSA